MSIAASGPHLTDIVVPVSDHPFFFDQPAYRQPRAAALEATDERLEQSLVDSLERAMLMIVAAGMCLFAAAFCRYGAPAGHLAHNAGHVFGALALIAGVVAIIAVLQGLSCLSRLFGEESS